jgi:uncharacterized membrane protein
MHLRKALIAQGAVTGLAFAPRSPLNLGLRSLNRQAVLTSALPSSSAQPRMPTASRRESQSNDDSYDVGISQNELSACWNPTLRNQLGVISALGSLETAYLSYDKVIFLSGGKTSSLVTALCSANDSGGASCGDVLYGPYSSLHLVGLDVPLSFLGLAAYILIFGLATYPLFISKNYANNNGTVLDGGNRIALLGGTTLMASFSMYLVALIVKVLHASCIFCFLSAGLSTSMAALSWFGGMLPGIEEMQSSLATMGADAGQFSNDVSELRKRGVAVAASSVGIATVMAVAVFSGVAEKSGNPDSLRASSLSSSGGGGMLIASAGSPDRYRENVPPRITTESSAAALTLASDLKSLNSRMFGAFWCSHCYDQKQELGYEAMESIPYVECDREGYNNERDLCKEQKVPGYPTWEIGGKLFPGERSLEELREIVDDVMSAK